MSLEVPFHPNRNQTHLEFPRNVFYRCNQFLNLLLEHVLWMGVWGRLDFEQKVRLQGMRELVAGKKDFWVLQQLPVFPSVVSL